MPNYSTRNWLSADKIVHALKQDKGFVELELGCWDFSIPSDCDYCRAILENQRRLIELNMADTRRIYNDKALQAAIVKISP